MSTRYMDTQKSNSKSSWLVTAGLTGALLTSACCLGPLVLVLLGVSGAWIGNLTAAKAFQPYFVTVAVVFLGFGFWALYKPGEKGCDGEKICANPKAKSLQRIVLWVATILILLAISVDWWAPFFY